MYACIQIHLFGRDVECNISDIDLRTDVLIIYPGSFIDCGKKLKAKFKFAPALNFKETILKKKRWSEFKFSDRLIEKVEVNLSFPSHIISGFMLPILDQQDY